METILVVEDDLAVQKALRRLFESEDYAVDVKPDGQAGLRPFKPRALQLSFWTCVCRDFLATICVAKLRKERHPFLSSF